MSRSIARVYVGNLGSNGNKTEIEKEFSRFGPIRDVWVARNPPGFAFVEFDDIRDAEDAIKELDGRRVCGVRVKVELSAHQGRSSRKPPPSNRGRGRYSPDNRYNDRYGPPSRSRYDDDRYAREPRGRRRERSPDFDRPPRRFSRSRSRSPPRY